MADAIPLKSLADKPLRVALVSEHKLARSGMAQALRAHGDLAVCGEFDHCRAMMAALMKDPPDVVVMELGVGGGEVLDALERCRACAPAVAHVVVSGSRDPELAERAIQAGARAYLYRTAGPESLVAAIRDAVAGELHVCRCIASPLLQKAIYGKSGHKTKHPNLACLSAREFQVFQLIGAGWDNIRIAQELGISVKTLNAHKEHLKQKLAFDSTSALKQAAASWQADPPLR